MPFLNLADGGRFVYGGGHEYGTVHNDLFVGSAGADTFHVGSYRNGGDDIISGFQHGIDHINIATQPWSVSWHDTAAGLKIEYYDSSITLLGYHGPLTASDFNWTL